MWDRCSTGDQAETWVPSLPVLEFCNSDFESDILEIGVAGDGTQPRRYLITATFDKGMTLECELLR